MSKRAELACLVPHVLDALDTESVFCLSWPAQVFVAITRVTMSGSQRNVNRYKFRFRM